MAKRLGLAKKDDFKLLWVTEFPQFEYSEGGRNVSLRCTIRSPRRWTRIFRCSTPTRQGRAKAYDIILNGCELGGGSIRIHDPELQTKMFEALGFTGREGQGAVRPSDHCVLLRRTSARRPGLGLDRLCMLLAGLDSIRDVIAFPKVQNASDLMMNCPDVVDDKQLDDLSIAVTRVEEEPRLRQHRIMKAAALLRRISCPDFVAISLQYESIAAKTAPRQYTKIYSQIALVQLCGIAFNH